MSVDGGKNRRCGMDVCERVGTDSVVSGRNGPLKSSVRSEGQDGRSRGHQRLPKCRTRQLATLKEDCTCRL
ncbi:hypothetical protein F442_06649 [Phytophthora nicotianae P10297]|uniref:Uncharacterized protein n=3 Tax=Phytophthora nicotianae TaxID=4792 RepID=V9FDQ6_PHYNI|nr:hypothetical protein F443_06607 [Phytophthora nicotianae P1569]ETO78309.1 hypothetical protein F444_06679 [Phytophthora nicotianae P1976]ETP47318.1 hypothetical protein F442_06649 [Phytophthora nicotianae P10297]